MKITKSMNGKAEFSVLVSANAVELHEIFMDGGEGALNLAIYNSITEEFENARDPLFKAIQEFVMIRQAQLEATSK